MDRLVHRFKNFIMSEAEKPEMIDPADVTR
jgi:hypothetical protein